MVVALIASIYSYFAFRQFRLISLYWLAIAEWSFTVGFQVSIRSIIDHNLWGWFLHIGCIFIPIIFFHLASRLQKEYVNTLRTRVAIFVGYSLAVFFVLFNTFTSVFTDEIIYRDYYAYPRPAILYPTYFVFFIACLFWGTCKLIWSIHSLPQEKRPYLILFLIVHCIAYVGGMDNFLIMADLTIYPLYPFGLYPAAIYAGVGTFALTHLIRYKP
jgi:hypothetical protein